MPATFEPRLLELAVHDLRNSLNSINMALHLIEGGVPEGHDELRSDVTMLSESVHAAKRMVQYLADYCHLFDGRTDLTPGPFNPRATVMDVVERSPAAPGRIQVDFRPDCPQVVELVPGLAHKAIEYALANALIAAKGGPVRLTADGAEDRWVIAIAVDEAPEANFRPGPIRPDDLERLVSTHCERRGLELAIAARISEIFGGSAHLEAEDNRSSRIVLDWPTSMLAVS